MINRFDKANDMLLDWREGNELPTTSQLKAPKCPKGVIVINSKQRQTGLGSEKWTGYLDPAQQLCLPAMQGILFPWISS